MLNVIERVRTWLARTPREPGMVFTPTYVGPTPAPMSKNEQTAITFVRETIAALYFSLDKLMKVQKTHLISLGQNIEARFQISVELTQKFYQEGVGEVTTESLKKLGSEAELQALVWQYFCGATDKQLEQAALARILESNEGRARFGLPPRGPSARPPNRYRSA